MRVVLHCLVCDDHREIETVKAPGEPVACLRTGCNALIEPQVVLADDGDNVPVASPWEAHPHRHAVVRGHKNAGMDAGMDA